MREQFDETFNLILCECCKLAQKKCRRRYDLTARKIHWNIGKKNGFQVNNRWYEYIVEPEQVT